MKEKFGIVVSEDYALQEVPSVKELRQYIQEDEGGPNKDGNYSPEKDRDPQDDCDQRKRK
jgi:hypothetical protein